MRKLLAILLVVPALLLAPAVASAKTVHMGKGQTLQVVLRENPSTGYGWSVTTKPKRSILKAKKGKFVSDPNPKDANGNQAAGVGGRRFFYWKAVGHGTTTIVIKQFPPGSRKAVKSVRYTVVVR
jgi:predicted secreted protein